jgi:CcmD family protein
MIRRRLQQIAAFATVLLAGPAVALAQEFQKVEGPTQDQVPAKTLVAVAYSFIWVAVLIYVLFVARALGRVRDELTDLRRKVDGAARSGRPPEGP